MKVTYARRAVADLARIGEETREAFGEAVAGDLLRRLLAIEQRLGVNPLSGRAVVQRPDVRIVPLLRFPFVLFYRVLPDEIRILHIRHTSRRPW